MTVEKIGLARSIFQNMSMPMKVAMTIILDALATLGVILSINCGMLSGRYVQKTAINHLNRNLTDT